MAQELTLKELVARNHREQMFAQGAASGAGLAMQRTQIAQSDTLIQQNSAILNEVAEQRRVAEHALSLQQEANDNAAKAAFALWRQTPHGEAYIDWRDRAFALSALLHNRDAAWAAALKQDAERAITPEIRTEIGQLSARFIPAADGTLSWKSKPSAADATNRVAKAIASVGLAVAIISGVYTVGGMLAWVLLWTGWPWIAFWHATAVSAVIPGAIGVVGYLVCDNLPASRAQRERAGTERKKVDANAEIELAEATATWKHLSSELVSKGATVDERGRISLKATWTSIDTEASITQIHSFMNWAYTNHPGPSELPPLLLPELNRVPSGLRSCTALLDEWSGHRVQQLEIAEETT